METVERRVGGTSEVQDREDPLEAVFSAVVIEHETHFDAVALETCLIGGGKPVASTGARTERDADAAPGLRVDTRHGEVEHNPPDTYLDPCPDLEQTFA